MRRGAYKEEVALQPRPAREFASKLFVLQSEGLICFHFYTTLHIGGDYMEILFENSYSRKKELAKEIYCYYYFQRKWVVVCYVLIALTFLANILIAIFEKTFNWGALVFAPLYFLFRIYCYFYQVNAMVKRDNELYGKEISVETVVTNEYIQNTATTGAVNKVEYDKIRNAVQTKNLILLRSKANLIYIFRKDTFTKGDKDSFIRFLNDKGIKIK